uniref:Uncharacterized protein n=1 Tax=Nelumbo nucifera TaxID=4432 RepID=A0A822Z2Z5_NELNU|nr:TPA_asm: hypothetical protein HUJ06_013715 [Nelumbo nucifera]
MLCFIKTEQGTEYLHFSIHSQMTKRSTLVMNARAPIMTTMLLVPVVDVIMVVVMLLCWFDLHLPCEAKLCIHCFLGNYWIALVACMMIGIKTPNSWER